MNYLQYQHPADVSSKFKVLNNLTHAMNLAIYTSTPNAV